MFPLNKSFSLLIRSTLLALLCVFSNTVSASLIQDITLDLDNQYLGTVTLPTESGSVSDCDDGGECSGFLFSFYVQLSGVTFDQSNVDSAFWEIDDNWQMTSFRLTASNVNNNVVGCDMNISCNLEIFESFSGPFARLVINKQAALSGLVSYQPVHTVPEPSTLILLSLGVLGFWGSTRRASRNLQS